MTGDTHVAGGPAADDPGDFAHYRQEILGFVPRHVSRDEIEREVHGGGALGRLNSRVAVLITNAVGTMWAAYVFTLLALVSLPAAIDAFNSGQIIVGQNVISTAQDKRAEQDHHTLTVLHRINLQQLKLLEQQQEILDRLGTGPGPAVKPA